MQWRTFGQVTLSAEASSACITVDILKVDKADDCICTLLFNSVPETGKLILAVTFHPHQYGPPARAPRGRKPHGHSPRPLIHDLLGQSQSLKFAEDAKFFPINKITCSSCTFVYWETSLYSFSQKEYLACFLDKQRPVTLSTIWTRLSHSVWTPYTLLWHS